MLSFHKPKEQKQAKLDLPSASKSGSLLMTDEERPDLAHSIYPYGIIVVVAVMLCYGLLMLFSASMNQAWYENDNSLYFLGRQVVFSIMGILAAYFVSRFSLGRLKRRQFCLLAYAFVLLLLILVLTPVGIRNYGHARWLPLLPKVTFQPTEIAKIVLVYVGAYYYSQLPRLRQTRTYRGYSPSGQLLRPLFFDFGLPLAALGLWILLIARQSHLSAALLLCLLFLAILSVAKIPKRSWILMLMIAAVLVLILLLIWIFFGEAIKAHANGQGALGKAISRIAIFIDGDSVSRDDRYQSDQALIAIGSGGFWGRGLGSSIQKNNYLPEAHNDYIFSVICEEFGFIGAFFVLLLFASFCFLGFQIARRVEGIYYRMLAVGYTSLITLQALLSMAVNLKIFIPTGISLPFFSYGGSSNIFFLVSVGLLLNVVRHGQSETQGKKASKAKQVHHAQTGKAERT